uniref:Uncharacterized protein n=1 Tax=Glossina palpalis gambiensis TaxID=67801 RepID=A0A1B0BPI0_9MUSC
MYVQINKYKDKKAQKLIFVVPVAVMALGYITSRVFICLTACSSNQPAGQAARLTPSDYLIIISSLILKFLLTLKMHSFKPNAFFYMTKISKIVIHYSKFKSINVTCVGNITIIYESPHQTING